MATLPKIRSVILCDDVRQENNRKEILIGVYSGGIRFSKAAPPGRLHQLCLRIEMELDVTRTLQLTLISPAGVEMINDTQEIAISDAGRAIMVFNHKNVVFYEAGAHKIMAGLNGELEEIDTVDVSFGPLTETADTVSAANV